MAYKAVAGYRAERQRLELRRRELLRRSVSAGRGSGGLELIVEVEGRRKEKAARSLEQLGKLTHVFDFIPYMSVQCGAKDAQMLAGSGNSLSSGYAELRAMFRKIEVASDFSVPKPKSVRKFAKSAVAKGGVWNLENIGAYAAREHSSGEGVNIAVIDTGIEYNHPEVERRFGSVKGYDVIEGNDNPADRNGHGTHVAGIFSGQNYGIAIRSTLYAVRVLDENGSGSESDIIAGIEWCITNGIHVANLSLGSPVASSGFEAICYAAADKGLILVAAAGNNGGEFAMYPAAFGDPVIAVAAVDRYNRHADFSNSFFTNDVSAPGVGITSSYIGGSYATLDGTSMASPHVAGAVVASAAENIGNERAVFGAGLVRADRMVEELLQPAYGRHRLLEAIKTIVW
ncbi:S8 family peptidase [Candidatus Woesearchaeota archaeon]|nr:S8 family peptidase [Candidatus Woesearchaeota archaeon]